MIDLRHGDCLDILPNLPDGSVDMILCDPPYGTAGGMGKGEARYARIAAVEWDVPLLSENFLPECNRILRQNGAMALFSQEPYTSRLITEAHPNLPFSYRLLWLKDHFSNSLLVNKAPVSYFEDIVVCFKKYDTMAQHPTREYSKVVLNHCGGNLKAVNERLGHRRAEHFFYVESTQFGLCTEETYGQICEAYDLSGQEWFKSFAQLKSEYEEHAPKRTFNLPENKKFKSNVLQYKKDYNGYHPTQKPIALLEDLITTYTNEGDTVLDFTMGSGSTGVAARNASRQFIGIERDPEYFAIAQQRIFQTANDNKSSSAQAGDLFGIAA